MFLSVRASGWRTAEAPGKPPYHEVALTVGGPHVATSDGTLVAPTDGEWRVVLDDGPAVRDVGLRSMAVTDDGKRLWFLDRSGLLAAYDVESGTRHDVSTPADGTTWEGVAVSGAAGDERGLVASGDGTVRAFTGTGNDVSWQSSASPTASGETVAVLAVAPDGVGYVVDTGGNAVRTGTSGWTGMGRVNPQTTLYGIHAAAGERVALAAADGRLYQYDPQDGTWTGRRVTNAPLRSVDRAGDRFVVGSGGSDVYVEPDGEPFWQVSHTPTSGTVRDLEADGELVVAVGGSYISQQVPGRATSGAESGSSTPTESDAADAEAREDADERGVWEPAESTGPSKAQPSPPSDASSSQSSGQGEQSGQSKSKKQSGQSTEETASEKHSDRSATKDDSTSKNQSDQSASKEKSTPEKQTGQSTSKDETSSEKHSDKSASKEKSASEKQSGKSASEGNPTAEEQSDETTPQENTDGSTGGTTSEKQPDESASGSKSAEQSDQSTSKQSGRPTETRSGTQTSEDLWGDEDVHSGLWESRDTEHATSNQDPIDYFEEHELFEVVDYEDVADLVDCVTVLVDDAGERHAVELATPADPEQHSDPVSHFRDERDEFVVEPYDDVESFEECVALVTQNGDVYAVLVDPERGPEREWSALDYFPDYDDYAVVPYVDVERFDEYVTLVVDDAGERYAVLLDDAEDDAPEDV
ncbi:hypothetical protein [Halospeciosus flavus]|uniref:PQQ-like domain-containing protein n=1 Tax=Halospeciosus flavus TaxID=3032283 RepID=A0ABD5Z1T4_9EURY|nr:hypothetical protein [Halospeciosus flavus]